MIKTDQKKNKVVDLEFQVPSYHIPIDKFFQFGLSIDCMVFGYEKGALKVLLIERGVQPYIGAKALPGDLVYPNEEIEVAAQRILKDLTGLDNVFLKQTKSYGNVDRHPIGRVVTIGYYSLIDISRYDPKPFTWATNVFWCDVSEIPELAFDHNEILKDGLNRFAPASKEGTRWF
jgi:8-oxo-dGTP diphosphatase